MKILILGGIGEALTLVRQCIDLRQSNPTFQVIYSLAGRARVAELDCEVLVGGFGGAEGIQHYLVNNRISMVIDVTHPYAATMSQYAALACEQAVIPLLRYLRDPWQSTNKDQWLSVASCSEILDKTAGFKRPFFTIGRSVLSLLDRRRPANQHWFMRFIEIDYPTTDQGAVNHSIIKHDKYFENCTVIKDIGPFSLSQEQDLLDRNNIDVLVSKNSGGSAVFAKIEAARELSIPIIMLDRPKIPTISAQYSDLQELFARITEVVDHQARVFI